MYLHGFHTRPWPAPYQQISSFLPWKTLLPGWQSDLGRIHRVAVPGLRVETGISPNVQLICGIKPPGSSNIRSTGTPRHPITQSQSCPLCLRVLPPPHSGWSTKERHGHDRPQAEVRESRLQPPLPCWLGVGLGSISLGVTMEAPHSHLGVAWMTNTGRWDCALPPPTAILDAS